MRVEATCRIEELAHVLIEAGQVEIRHDLRLQQAGAQQVLEPVERAVADDGEARLDEAVAQRLAGHVAQGVADALAGLPVRDGTERLAQLARVLGELAQLSPAANGADDFAVAHSAGSLRSTMPVFNHFDDSMVSTTAYSSGFIRCHSSVNWKYGVALPVLPTSATREMQRAGSTPMMSMMAPVILPASWGGKKYWMSARLRPPASSSSSSRARAILGTRASICL